jgi:hypothetical protein
LEVDSRSSSVLGGTTVVLVVVTTTTTTTIVVVVLTELRASLLLETLFNFNKNLFLTDLLGGLLGVLGVLGDIELLEILLSKGNSTLESRIIGIVGLTGFRKRNLQSLVSLLSQVFIQGLDLFLFFNGGSSLSFRSIGVGRVESILSSIGFRRDSLTPALVDLLFSITVNK